MTKNALKSECSTDLYIGKHYWNSRCTLTCGIQCPLELWSISLPGKKNKKKILLMHSSASISGYTMMG